MSNTKAKKGPSLLTIFVCVMVVIGILAGDGFEDIFYLIVGLAAILIPVIVFFAIFRAIKKKVKPNVHSHDRIDHRRDLKVDSKTGKAVNRPVTTRAPHSAKEHWKEQLDCLLANGTIDRAEYKALMNRRF